jgi:hypothetical protein
MAIGLDQKLQVQCIWFGNLLILSVPDECYSRNASCPQN